MSKDVVQVQIKALIPTNAGVAVFVGNEEKIFVIYVDPSVGSAINMFVNFISERLLNWIRVPAIASPWQPSKRRPSS